MFADYMRSGQRESAARKARRELTTLRPAESGGIHLSAQGDSQATVRILNTDAGNIPKTNVTCLESVRRLATRMVEEQGDRLNPDGRKTLTCGRWKSVDEGSILSKRSSECGVWRGHTLKTFRQATEDRMQSTGAMLTGSL